MIGNPVRNGMANFGSVACLGGAGLPNVESLEIGAVLAEAESASAGGKVNEAKEASEKAFVWGKGQFKSGNITAAIAVFEAIHAIVDDLSLPYPAVSEAVSKGYEKLSDEAYAEEDYKQAASLSKTAADWADLAYNESKSLPGPDMQQMSAEMLERKNGLIDASAYYSGLVTAIQTGKEPPPMPKVLATKTGGAVGSGIALGLGALALVLVLANRKKSK